MFSKEGLRALIASIKRIKADQAELNEELGDIKKTAKRNGYNMKAVAEAMRIADMESGELASVEQYLGALDVVFGVTPMDAVVDAIDGGQVSAKAKARTTVRKKPKAKSPPPATAPSDAVMAA